MKVPFISVSTTTLPARGTLKKYYNGLIHSPVDMNLRLLFQDMILTEAGIK